MESLYPGDLVNHMKPEVDLRAPGAFSDVGTEGRMADVVVGDDWLVVVVFIVDFLKGR